MTVKRKHYQSFCNLLCKLLLIMPLGTLMAQQDFSNVDFTTTEITPNLFMLASGEGGNIAVSLGGDGVLIIDDDMSPLTAKLQQAIAGITNEKVRFVLNTHWHFDHTGANEVMGKEGAVIIAHDNVYKRLQKGQYMEAFRMDVPPAAHSALPVITFNKDMTVHWNNDTLDLVHVAPAHTDGDAIVYFQAANVVHMGDLFWNGIYPFIDGGSGGSTAGVIAAVAAALQRMDENTKVIPGHGPLGNKAELQAYHDMIKTVYSRIKKLKDAGKTMEDVVKMTPTAEFDASWGAGLFTGEQWTQMVYSTL